nr:hypothetical protein LTR18_006541 [Exophiala xenobiotica]
MPPAPTQVASKGYLAEEGEEPDLSAIMRYSPLESGSIRVLEILQPDESVFNDVELRAGGTKPTSEGTTTTVSVPSCRLTQLPLRSDRDELQVSQVDLGLPHKFVAISYTWGDKEDVDSISMDGYVHVVQRNLKNALLALRSTDLILSGCRVWVDALCIDQSNAAEVNREIKRMKQIYKEALAVIMWLGDEADASDLAIDFINAVDIKWHEGTEVFETWLSRKLIANGPAIWPALSKLITREYWTRLWIIQEVAIGGDNTTVLCGSKVTTWTRLHQVYDAFHIFTPKQKYSELAACIRGILLGSSTPSFVYDSYKNTLFWQWEACEDFQILQSRPNDPCLEAYRKRCLLTRCRIAKCEKPVDKVYGIFGLLDDRIAAKIEPDYNLGVREVFMSFARAWMLAEGHLGLLIHCGETGEQEKGPLVDIEGLPSWAPNLLKQVKLQLNNSEPEFNSHGGMRASRLEYTGEDGSVLSVEAVLFDTLDGLSGTRHWSDDVDTTMVEDIEDSKWSVMNAYGPDDNDFRAALWRALIGGRDRYGCPVGADYECVLDIAILQDRCAPPIPCPVTGDTDGSLRWNLHLWVKRNRTFRLGGRCLQDWFCHDLDVMKNDPGLYYRCTGRVINWMWCRRLATTKRGYIAVVPKVSRPGDVVAILPGCSCPLLLRSNPRGMKNAFEIVAECYLQGLMDGEILGFLEQGLCRVEDVLIV